MEKQEGTLCTVCGQTVSELKSHVLAEHPEAAGDLVPPGPKGSSAALTEAPPEEETVVEPPALPQGSPAVAEEPPPSPPPLAEPVLGQDLKQLIDRTVVEAVNRAANQIAQQLPGLVNNMLTARLDQINADHPQQQALQAQQPPETPAAQPGRGGLGEALQALMGFQQLQQMQGGGAGMANMKGMLDQVNTLQQISAALWAAPMKIIADLMSLSIRSGATPEGASEALKKISTDMAPAPATEQKAEGQA